MKILALMFLLLIAAAIFALMPSGSISPSSSSGDVASQGSSGALKLSGTQEGSEKPSASEIPGIIEGGKVPKVSAQGSKQPTQLGVSKMRSKVFRGRGSFPSQRPAKGTKIKSRSSGQHVETADAPEVSAPSEEPPGLVKADIRELKNSIRQFYGNLPRSGQMPRRIEAEELIPIAVLDRMGIPGSARVTELGSWPISSPEGFKEALSMPEDSFSTLGLTVEFGGRTLREYIATEP